MCLLEADSASTAKVGSTTRESTITIVELGAGDYKNAIALKLINPKFRVIATNDPVQVAMGRDAVENGIITPQFHTLGMYIGMLAAKNAGVEVMNSNGRALSNQEIPNNIGDYVYTVAPNLWTANDFGFHAARIAKTGAFVGISTSISGSAQAFISGFNTLRPSSTFINFPGIFGESGYERHMTSYFTISI
jgi:hypothetical protein